MSSATYTLHGINIACRFDYAPGEPPEVDHPGWPDAYYLTHATVGGVDVFKLLDPAVVQHLEEMEGFR